MAEGMADPADRPTDLAGTVALIPLRAGSAGFRTRTSGRWPDSRSTGMP